MVQFNACVVSNEWMCSARDDTIINQPSRPLQKREEADTQSAVLKIPVQKVSSVSRYLFSCAVLEAQDRREYYHLGYVHKI